MGPNGDPDGQGARSRGTLAGLAVASGIALAANGVWMAVNLRADRALDRREEAIRTQQATLDASTWLAVERARRLSYPAIPLGARVGAPIVTPNRQDIRPAPEDRVACVTARFSFGARVYAITDPLEPGQGAASSDGTDVRSIVIRRHGAPVRIEDARLLGYDLAYVPRARCPADVTY